MHTGCCFPCPLLMYVVIYVRPICMVVPLPGAWATQVQHCWHALCSADCGAEGVAIFGQGGLLCVMYVLGFVDAWWAHDACSLTGLCHVALHLVRHHSYTSAVFAIIGLLCSLSLYFAAELG